MGNSQREDQEDPLLCRALEKLFPWPVMCSVAHPCPTLCDTLDGSPPGSSVQGIVQAGTLEWVAVPCPPPGDLPDPGIKHTVLMSPALAGVPSGKPVVVVV